MKNSTSGRFTFSRLLEVGHFTLLERLRRIQSKYTCKAVVLLIISFVCRRSRCRRRKPISDVVLLPCRTKLPLGSAKARQNITLIQTLGQSHAKFWIYRSHLTNLLVPPREKAVPSKYINTDNL